METEEERKKRIWAKIEELRNARKIQEQKEAEERKKNPNYKPKGGCKCGR